MHFPISTMIKNKNAKPIIRARSKMVRVTRSSSSRSHGIMNAAISVKIPARTDQIKGGFSDQAIHTPERQA